MKANIFQSKSWGEFKLKTGYEKSYRVNNVLVLQKKLSLNKTILYSPMVGKSLEQEIIRKEYFDKIKQIAIKNKAIFYRLELNISEDSATDFEILNAKYGFKKSFEEMQPEHNWLLDITKPEKEILANMKQKGRYNIKIATNAKIKIFSSNKAGEELDDFYEQYSATGKRHKISFRGKKYFESLLEILGQKDYARVYSAKKNDTPLASAIIIYYKKECLYLYGGSSEDMRSLMGPYFLHWEIIKEAKKRGCTEYNFLGIAPDDNPNHPWAGITRFKKQFGGEQVNLLGCYDLPLKPLEYKMFKIAEKIRRH